MGNILTYFACKNIEIYLTEQHFISISKKPTKIAYMIEKGSYKHEGLLCSNVHFDFF